MLRRLTLPPGPALLAFCAAARIGAQAPARNATSSDAPASAVATRAVSSVDDARRRAALRERLQVRISFGFDRYDLTADARVLLEEKLDIMRENHDVRLRITGYADRHGPADHNTALARQRAAAARRFLTQRGIAAERIEIRGVVESAPAGIPTRPASDDRRAEFAVVHGLR